MADYERSLVPPLVGRQWLLGALFLVSLPHLLRMPVWFSAFCLAVFTWRLLHELRGYDLPGRFLRYMLVFLGIAAVGAAYRTFVGHEPGVALLTLMLCLKLLELRTMRDALIALFIGYFMVFGGFIFSQSILMGGYLFLVVLALTAALITLNHPAGSNANYRFYFTTGGKLLLQALPLMVVLFVLFPRLSSPLWGMPESRAAKTGLSDSIEMGSISKLVDSAEVAFRVDFDGPIPAADKLYWRGPVLWQTDGKRWTIPLRKPTRTLPDFTPGVETVGYTVTLEPSNRHWLFALDLPLALPKGIGDVFVQSDFQLLRRELISKKLQYSVRSTTDYQITDLPLWMFEAGTDLPRSTNPQTVALAKRWRDENMDDNAVIRRAINMIREQPFYYTRQPPLLGDNPVDEFLFTTRRGFCEHYATAFVTLMRAADIPARVVTGYQGGELNALGNYLIVRQSNAHAWAEVWLDEGGWVRVDPTAAIPPERVETTTDAARFRTTDLTAPDLQGNSLLREFYWKWVHGWDALNHSWNHWILGFDQQRQQALLKKLGMGGFDWGWVIGIMAGLIFGMLGIIGAVTFLRRPRQRDPVLRLYQQFCSRLEKAGFVRAANEGPDDFAQRVIGARPDLAATVDHINALYVRLRYSPNARAEHLEQLRRLVAAFRPGS